MTYDYAGGLGGYPWGNAVKDFFTRENAWAYAVAEVVRLRAMPETTKFSRIRLQESFTALPFGVLDCQRIGFPGVACCRITSFSHVIWSAVMPVALWATSHQHP